MAEKGRHGVDKKYGVNCVCSAIKPLVIPVAMMANAHWYKKYSPLALDVEHGARRQDSIRFVRSFAAKVMVMVMEWFW